MSLFDFYQHHLLYFPLLYIRLSVGPRRKRETRELFKASRASDFTFVVRIHKVYGHAHDGPSSSALLSPGIGPCSRNSSNNLLRNCVGGVWVTSFVF